MINKLNKINYKKLLKYLIYNLINLDKIFHKYGIYLVSKLQKKIIKNDKK